MHKIMVAGIGTKVGKTVVSAILTTLMNGNYWKPVQCSDEKNSDTSQMKTLVDLTKHHIYSPSYNLKAPVSPHQAAKLENIAINVESIIPPESNRHLIIEGVGGILVPLTVNFLSLNLFKQWNCPWIVVSKNYLGSINHTLLTIEVLKHQGISIAGIIFNGTKNIDSETAILKNSQLPLLGRLNPEPIINKKTIQRYAKQWQRQFLPLFP